MGKNLRAMELSAVIVFNICCLIIMGLCHNQIYTILEKSPSSILDNLAYVILLLTSISSLDKISVYISNWLGKIGIISIISIKLVDIILCFLFLYLHNLNIQPLEIYGYKLFGTYWLTILTLIFNIGACLVDIGEYQRDFR